MERHVAGQKGEKYDQMGEAETHKYNNCTVLYRAKQTALEKFIF